MARNTPKTAIRSWRCDAGSGHDTTQFERRVATGSVSKSWLALFSSLSSRPTPMAAARLQRFAPTWQRGGSMKTRRRRSSRRMCALSRFWCGGGGRRDDERDGKNGRQLAEWVDGAHHKAAARHVNRHEAAATRRLPRILCSRARSMAHKDESMASLDSRSRRRRRQSDRLQQRARPPPAGFSEGNAFCHRASVVVVAAAVARKATKKRSPLLVVWPPPCRCTAVATVSRRSRVRVQCGDELKPQCRRQRAAGQKLHSPPSSSSSSVDRRRHERHSTATTSVVTATCARAFALLVFRLVTKSNAAASTTAS